MSRRLQFGSGPNLLPEPWENLDIETDIRKPLPFPIGSASFILAEHVIEHVGFRAGLAFLGECLRVLEVGGVLRLSFPDITRNIKVSEYKPAFSQFYARQMNSEEDIWLSMLTDWGHQSCWTAEMAGRCLLAVGFSSCYRVTYGLSIKPELKGIDGHHLSVGLELAQAETTVFEAIR